MGPLKILHEMYCFVTMVHARLEGALWVGFVGDSVKVGNPDT